MSIKDFISLSLGLLLMASVVGIPLFGLFISIKDEIAFRKRMNSKK